MKRMNKARLLSEILFQERERKIFDKILFSLDFHFWNISLCPDKVKVMHILIFSSSFKKLKHRVRFCIYSFAI